MGAWRHGGPQGYEERVERSDKRLSLSTLFSRKRTKKGFGGCDNGKKKWCDHRRGRDIPPNFQKQSVPNVRYPTTNPGPGDLLANISSAIWGLPLEHRQNGVIIVEKVPNKEGATMGGKGRVKSFREKTKPSPGWKEQDRYDEGKDCLGEKGISNTSCRSATVRGGLEDSSLATDLLGRTRGIRRVVDTPRQKSYVDLITSRS